MTRSIDQNIRRYPWIQLSSSLFGWLPVFFLYFNSMVSLSDAILLGSLYYVAVTLLEVPSGYFSDRVGRRITILVSATGFVVANLAYLAATDFTGLVLGQVLLALGMAFLSGTDTAFLYDSLLSAGREEAYADHEARGQQFSMAGLAIASLAGGFLGLADLRLPYGLALLGAAWMFWLTWGCLEPPVTRDQAMDGQSFLQAVRTAAGLLSDRLLAWLFGAMVFMYCLEHIAYEFYQPYIRLLDLRWFHGDSSPAVSGIVIGISMFGGTLGAALSIRLYRRLGLKALLYIAFAVQLVIIGGLALVLAPLMLFSVVLRNFPMAMIHAPVNANIAPRVPSSVRATYLSLQSLMARLVFSALLFALSSLVAGQSLDWPALATVLRGALLFGVTGALLVMLFAPRDGMESA